jgi:hypothetical protein
MPNTLTPGVAVSIVGLKYPRLLADAFAARFCNEVQDYIWYRYPWRGTLADLPPFGLTQDEPDYGPPLLAVPADFYGLHRAWIRSSTGRILEPELQVKPDLGLSVCSAMPTTIAFQKAKGCFRLHPRPAFAAPDYWVEGEYKKLPETITNENLNSYTFVWDDLYFQVFRAGLNWKVKEDLMSSPDAPNAYQMFEMLVDRMAMAEGLHSGVVTVAPSEGLELGG